VPSTASEKDIETAARSQLQRWSKATNHPDMGKRQEAEHRVKNISEGKLVLSDPARRRRYDQDWAAHAARPEPTPAASAGGGDRNWILLAERYLAENDYASASYAAREATRQQGENAATWSLRAQANLGLNNVDEALYEARQAAEIEPSNSTYHYNLAQVQEAAGKWDAAINSYQVVDRLNPGSPGGKLGIASVYLQIERPQEARRITAELRRAYPQDATVGFYHGSALVNSAEQVPRVKGGGQYVVTTAAEIAEMMGLLTEARAATGDAAVRESIADIEKYLGTMNRRTFNVPFGSGLGYSLFFLFVVFGGFGALGSGSVGGVFFGLLLLAAAFFMGQAALPPAWKVNARIARRTGR
jgi:tetratricopeptide (TPR) repeat protein